MADRRHSPLDVNVDTLTNQWVQHRVRAGLIRPKTGRRQRYELDRFREAHGQNRTIRADRRVFDRWLESIGGLSAGTRRGHVSSVHSFVVWAVAEGHVDRRALTFIPRVRNPRSVPRALTADQTAQLLRSVVAARQRAMVGLMLWGGLRCAEVAGLRVEDVDERQGSLHVTGKGDNQRIVPIPDEFAPYLSVWLDERRRIPGPLFPSRQSGHYRAATVSRLVSRWMVDAGVKLSAGDGRSAHALRHTAASDVLDGGASITTVQAMLGHQHLATTSVYLRRASLENLRTAMGGRRYLIV